MNREELRQGKKVQKHREDKIIFISTYDGRSNMIKKAIMKAWHTLGSDSKYGKLFQEIPRFIYRKGSTIGNSLVRSELDAKNRSNQVCSHKKGTYACMTCQNCSAIIKGPHINHPTKGHTIPLKGQYTWNSSNVIYILKCPCGKCYVGQTSRMIKIRLNEYSSSIRTYLGKSSDERKAVDESVRKFGETSVG